MFTAAGEGADCAEAVSEYKQAVTDMQEVVKAALVAVKAEEVDQVCGGKGSGVEGCWGGTTGAYLTCRRL